MERGEYWVVSKEGINPNAITGVMANSEKDIVYLKSYIDKLPTDKRMVIYSPDGKIVYNPF